MVAALPQTVEEQQSLAPAVKPWVELGAQLRINFGANLSHCQMFVAFHSQNPILSPMKSGREADKVGIHGTMVDPNWLPNHLKSFKYCARGLGFFNSAQPRDVVNEEECSGPGFCDPIV